MMQKTNDGQKSGPVQCTCVTNPFTALPPELRPRPRKKSSLRKVTCPGCGLVYWTNRTTDLCMECEKEGGQIPVDKP